MSNEAESPQAAESPRRFIAIIAAVALVAFAVSYGVSQFRARGGNEDAVIAGDYSSQLATLKSHVPVVIVREGCPACAAAKAWLASSAYVVEFRDTKVDSDAKAIAKSMPYYVVPVLITRDKAVLGFSEIEWRAALAPQLDEPGQ